MTSSGCYSVKVLSATVDYFLVAMVRDLFRHLIHESRRAWYSLEHCIQCMPYSSRIISELLPEIHTMEKCDFLKSVIHSEII